MKTSDLRSLKTMGLTTASRHPPACRKPCDSLRYVILNEHESASSRQNQQPQEKMAAMKIVWTDGASGFYDTLPTVGRGAQRIRGRRTESGSIYPLNSVEKIHDVAIAYDGAIPVGCGSLKQYSEKVAEISGYLFAPNTAEADCPADYGSA